MDRDPFPRRTATPATLVPWLPEVARTLPAFARAFGPWAILDSRRRERIMIAVTEVNGCRYCAWIHGGWTEFLGERELDAAEIDEAVLAFARACAEAGEPLDPSALAEVLPPAAVESIRATVAHIEVANLVGNTVDGVLARLTRKRPLDPVRAAGELATLAIAAPVAVPLLGVGAALRTVSRLAPDLPAVDMPPAGRTNLLAHLLAQAVPAYLANAAVRTAVLGLPFAASIGLRAGRTTATLTVGRGRIAVRNGITSDALVVVEGDVEPLLRLASGTLLRELGAVRLRPNT